MAIFTTLSVVIWFSTGALGIFATLVYVFTMRVVIYDILSMAIIPTLSTSILFCNLCYILLWISPRSVVKIAIQIHSNLDLARVSGMAYTRSRFTLKLSKCKQSGPYEILSSCRLPAPSKHIRAAFSLSSSECKICALLLALMCC